MKNKSMIVIAVCLAALILPLSFSGTVTAIASISREIGGDPVELAWIINAFMLTFGSSLMAIGAIADQYGRKRVFITGVGSFAFISVILGFCSHIFVFDILRAVQGVAAAAALAGGSAVLAQEFDGQTRTKVFSFLGATFGVGLAFGPVIAGGIIQLFGWRGVFLISAIIGVCSLIISIPKMNESKDPNAKGLDWWGTALFTLCLSLLTFAIILAPEKGWQSHFTIFLLSGSLVTLVVFIVVELRLDKPMLDLSLFKYTQFIGVQFLPIATCFSYIVFLVILPLRFINIEGYNELSSGLFMIALSLPMLFIPILAASLTRWFSAGVISSVGLFIASIGLVWFSFLPVGTSPMQLIFPMLIIGFGTGLPWGLMDGLSVSMVPKERAGMATGIFSTTRIASEGISMAIVTAILSAFIYSGLSDIISCHTESVDGIHLAAQHLAFADISATSAHLKDISLQEITFVYSESFKYLLWLLAGITMSSAVIVLTLLNKIVIVSKE